MDGLEPLAISASETARILGISRPTVYQLFHQAGFPVFKVGNRTLVSVDGLRTWIAKQTEVTQE
mgnify:FL=1